MPDRYGDESGKQLSREEIARVAQEASESGKRIAEIARIAEIGRCGLCNSDGYRGSQVCDHLDRTESAKRGMDMIRDTMGWKP